ncbi:MAG TPA: Spx/MgsR family RNA polymerase-binding regulatory protein [Alphaproteobacteria bacterium]|nr:Spx/MgsR family RNA polymerase-binding regulatory protein [Alphaproteobacteria bacterium]
MIVVNGLKSCDTCRKARAWLTGKGIAHRFHDLRADGLAADQARRWLKAAGAERLVNRRGTTWRGLGEAERIGSGDEEIVVLLVAHPALIKRPVFERGDAVFVGFDDAARAALTAASNR